MSELNPRWADALVSGWIRAGVRHAVICPGSRSAPLALACARAAGLTCWSILDERSAGFFALGLGQATGLPALVVVTSGTAGAHLYPAVIEAALTHVPLLVATADRPWELQGWGAAQTIPQPRLFGGFARWELELPAPEESEAAFRHLEASAVRAVAAAAGSPAGPVHVNAPFREPLAAQSSSPPLPERHPRLSWHRPAPQPDGRALDIVAGLVTDHPRGVILAGPHRPGDGLAAALAALSRATGYPVLAEVTSNARLGEGGSRAVAHLDALLRVPSFADEHLPDVVLRFGGGLTARNTLGFAERGRHLVAFPGSGPVVDPAHAASHVVEGDAVAAAHMLAGRISRGDGEWARGWFGADRAVARALSSSGGGAPMSEPAVARGVFEALPDGANVVLASSMPIRDADAFVPAGEKVLHVFSNRGANGIEGTLSTALGIAAGTGRPTWVLVGDLAFLHDMGALLTALRSRLPLGVVVVNNDGGGIFSFLPVAAAGDAFEPLFGVSHGLGFRALAEQFRAEYREVVDVQSLCAAVRAPLERIRVVEAKVPPRDENVLVHRRLFEALRAAVEAQG